MHGHAAGDAAQPPVPAAASGFGVHAPDETASGVPDAVRAAVAAVPDASSLHLAYGMNMAVPNAVVLAAEGIATLSLDGLTLYLSVQEKGGDGGASAATQDLAPFGLGADDKTRWEEDARREGEEREGQRLHLVRQLENVQVQAPESVVPVPASAERLPAAEPTGADDPLLETDGRPAPTSEELERQLENA